MRNKYLWAAALWTTAIAVCCLVSMKTFDPNVVKGKYTDKYVHFTFYFGFTILWFLAMRFKNLGSQTKTRGMVFIMAVIFGILIELSQQFFTVDRSADVVDVLANSTGSAVAVVVLWLIDKYKK